MFQLFYSFFGWIWPFYEPIKVGGDLFFVKIKGGETFEREKCLTTPPPRQTNIGRLLPNMFPWIFKWISFDIMRHFFIVIDLSDKHWKWKIRQGFSISFLGAFIIQASPANKKLSGKKEIFYKNYSKKFQCECPGKKIKMHIYTI